MALRLFMIILLTTNCLRAFAQDAKLVIKNFPHSRQISERYYVLRSNPSLKHGDYVSYFPLDKTQYKSVKKFPDSLEHYIRKHGAYVNGKKHGPWIEYDRPGVLYTSGTYDMVKKTGVWTTSRENGEVLEKFDHDTRQKLTPEIRIPFFYPPKAREAGAEGTVIVEFQVQSDCVISQVKVVQSVHPDCDKAATQKLLKYDRYLKTYGPPQTCEPKIETFRVVFKLE